MLDYLFNSYNYLVSIILMMVGFYIVIYRGNFVKKLMGLAIFQTSVLLLYITSAYVEDARFPILKEGVEHYVNPLPHVLMLTAIVVGVATLAVGLSLVVRIKEAYGTIEEDEILKIDEQIVSTLYESSKTHLSKDDFTPAKVKKTTKKPAKSKKRAG